MFSSLRRFLTVIIVSGVMLLVAGCDFSFTSDVSPKGTFTGSYIITKTKDAFTAGGEQFPAARGEIVSWSESGVTYVVTATDDAVVLSLTFSDVTAVEVDELVGRKASMPNPAPSGIFGQISYENEHSPAPIPSPSTPAFFPFSSIVQDGKVMVGMSSERLNSIINPNQSQPTTPPSKEDQEEVRKIARGTRLQASITMPGDIIAVEGSVPGMSAVDESGVIQFRVVNGGRTVLFDAPGDALLDVKTPSGMLFAVTSTGGKEGYTYPSPEASASTTPEATSSPSTDTTEPVSSPANVEGGSGAWWLPAIGMLMLVNLGGVGYLVFASRRRAHNPVVDEWQGFLDAPIDIHDHFEGDFPHGTGGDEP